ncbi:MAG: universal stress protein [Clostridia bacterium]|nr:universal stress protein [Clostridia bacterium]
MKILLTIDGSEYSIRASEYAAKLTKYIPNSKVTLLYVDTLLTLIKTRGGVLPPDFERALDVNAEDALEKAKKIFIEKDLPFDVKVLEGYDVATTIANCAKEFNYDQIIMGTRGLGSIKGILLGSVSHKVLQIAPCAVTVVK